MEVSEGHARELAKQAARKAALREESVVVYCRELSELFLRQAVDMGIKDGIRGSTSEQTCVGIDLIAHRIRKGQEKCTKRQLSNLHFKAELGEFLEVLPRDIRFKMTVFFPDPA